MRSSSPSGRASVRLCSPTAASSEAAAAGPVRSVGPPRILLIRRRTGAGGSNCTCSGRALDRVAAGIGPQRRRRSRRNERAPAGSVRWTRLRPPMRALGVALAGAVGLARPRGDHLRRRRRRLRSTFFGPLIRPALVSRLPPHLRGVELKAARSEPGEPRRRGVCRRSRRRVAGAQVIEACSIPTALSMSRLDVLSDCVRR